MRRRKLTTDTSAEHFFLSSLSLRLLLYPFCFFFLAQSAFSNKQGSLNCGLNKDLYSFNSDEDLYIHLKWHNLVFTDPSCLGDLMDINYFKSAEYQIGLIEKGMLPQTLKQMKTGMESSNNRLSNLTQYLQTHKKKQLVVEPPIQWAQSLNHVFIEVRYAHRHDAPGCAHVEDEDIVIKEDQITLNIKCSDKSSSITNSIVRYSLTLNLWAPIQVEESRHEYQAVGKQHFQLTKLKRPARWLTLQNTTSADKQSNKPQQLRLWAERHEKFVQQLWEFEGDDVDDFEGHQWMEDQEEMYQEYQHRKQIPKKGPIPLKKKSKKKKKQSKE